jgi:hypothetical protein
LICLAVAELEAAEAAIWYDDQRPGLGDDFLAELRQAFDRIRDSPRRFSPLFARAIPLHRHLSMSSTGSACDRRQPRPAPSSVLAGKIGLTAIGPFLSTIMSRKVSN